MMLDRTTFLVPAFLILIIIHFITITTTKDIIEEYNKKSKKSFEWKFYIASFVLTLVLILSANILGKFELNFNVVGSLFSVLVIQIYCCFLAFLTDVKLHRINRFTLRFAYITNFIFIIYLESLVYGEINWVKHISIIIALLIGFFLIPGIGSSDYRCWAITIPTLIFIYKEWSIIVIILNFVYIAIYQMIKVKGFKAKIPIPIGHQILLFVIMSNILGFIIFKNRLLF